MTSLTGPAPTTPLSVGPPQEAQTNPALAGDAHHDAPAPSSFAPEPTKFAPVTETAKESIIIPAGANAKRYSEDPLTRQHRAGDPNRSVRRAQHESGG